MSKVREETLAFLTHLLEDCGCIFTEDGSVRHPIIRKGKIVHQKVKIDDCDLVLPTQEQLNKPEGDTIVFAPFSESVLHGESAVITTLNKIMVSRLQYRVSVLMVILSELVLKGGKYNAKLRAILNKNSDLKENIRRPLKQLLSRVGNTPTRRIVNIYLKHLNVEYKGKKVKRLATVSSVLVDDLSKGETWGVSQMSKTQANVIATLVESILPGVNDDAYSYGTNSTIAPNFHALITAYYNVSSRLSDVEEMVDKYVDDATREQMAEPCHYKWVDGLENFYKMEKAFPALSGNKGNDIIGENANANLSNVKVNETSDNASSAVPSAANAPTGNAPTPTTAEPAKSVKVANRVM